MTIRMPMGQVFISYSRRNKEIVDRIVSALDRAGMDVWIDREDIQAGNSWRVQIVQAIDTCDAFVLMLSAHSAVSENVHKEINLAQDSKRKTFVFLLERIQLPAEIRYQLAGLQFIDVEELGHEEALSRLIETLNEHLATVRPVSQSSRQVELVIDGIDLASFGEDKQAQLLAFLAQLSNTDPSRLKIASLSTGSVHAYVDMPAQAAFALKTMALNRDRRFRKLGIRALKLVGDAYFIDIASGAFTPTAKMDAVRATQFQPPNPFSSFFSTTLGRLVVTGVFIAVLAGLAVIVPSALAPAILPTDTPTQTLTPSPSPTRTATSTSPPTSTATQTLTITLTPTQTDTPTATFTPTLDRSGNSIVVLLEGQTGDLQRCERIRFAARVFDPEGVKQVVIRFHVGDKEPTRRVFASPDAELYLTDEKDQLWAGYFYDTVSQYQRTTYWWFIVTDANGVATFYYEPGKFNYFARDFGCGVIPQ